MLFSFHSLFLPSAGWLHSQMMKLWLFILLAVPLFIDAISDCTAISKDEISNIALVVKECSGQEILGSDEFFAPRKGFSQSDFNKLFGKVKTLRMPIDLIESDIVNMVFPELEESADWFWIIANRQLRTIEFPKLEKFPKHATIWVIGSPALSDESTLKLKEMSIGIKDSRIVGAGDCFSVNGVITSPSELDGCKTISSGIYVDTAFNGTSNSVITRVDMCITIVGTKIDDISFLKLTERGTRWNTTNTNCKKNITIENNPNLCTSDFEKIIEKFDPKPSYSITNNKNKTVCENERAKKVLEEQKVSKTTETVSTTTTTAATTSTTEVNSSPSHDPLGNEQNQEEVPDDSETPSAPEVNNSPNIDQLDDFSENESEQKEQGLLEASENAPEMNSSAYQNIFVALCLVAAATIFAVL